MKTPSLVQRLLMTALVFCLFTAPRPSSAAELRKCPQGAQNVFDYRGNEVKYDDDVAACEREDGVVKEAVTIRFCVVERKTNSCRKLYGQDYIYFFRKSCCAYDAPADLFGW